MTQDQVSGSPAMGQDWPGWEGLGPFTSALAGSPSVCPAPFLSWSPWHVHSHELQDTQATGWEASPWLIPELREDAVCATGSVCGRGSKESLLKFHGPVCMFRLTFTILFLESDLNAWLSLLVLYSPPHPHPLVSEVSSALCLKKKGLLGLLHEDTPSNSWI